MTATIERTGSSAGLGPNTPQNDLRTFIATVEARGEVATVRGAHWNKELGAVTEVLYRQKVEKSPMLMFDDIPGYAPGYRCTYGMFGSPYRLGLVLGMESTLSDDRKAQLDYFRKNIKKAYKQIPPTIVNDGPVCENIVRDDDIDVEIFPVPIHHELDGGRYIGTACGVVTRDPDTGRINVGTYRVMVKGKRTLASYISNGKQGRIHRDKYLKMGKPCPVAIIVGIDPITYLAAAYTMADTVPEYDWCGGMMDRPMELIEGETTGLPFPARAEIVLEGWIHPTDVTREGPFGEWHGYYAGEAKDEPLITIDRVYYLQSTRSLTCAASQKPPHLASLRALLPAFGRIARLGSVKSAGIPDVRGAWLHFRPARAARSPSSRSKQRFPGYQERKSDSSPFASESGRLHRRAGSLSSTTTSIRPTSTT